MQVEHKASYLTQRSEWIKVLQHNASPPIFGKITNRKLSESNITICKTDKGERIYQNGKPISTYWKPEK